MSRKFAIADNVPATIQYITAGKRYEIHNASGLSFLIEDDEGDLIQCTWSNCSYLDGGNWICVGDES